VQRQLESVRHRRHVQDHRRRAARAQPQPLLQRLALRRQLRPAGVHPLPERDQPGPELDPAEQPDTQTDRRVV